MFQRNWLWPKVVKQFYLNLGIVKNKQKTLQKTAIHSKYLPNLVSKLKSEQNKDYAGGLFLICFKQWTWPLTESFQFMQSSYTTGIRDIFNISMYNIFFICFIYSIFLSLKNSVFYMPQTGYIKSIVGLSIILRELHFLCTASFQVQTIC